MDSRPDTYEHIRHVQCYLNEVIVDLLRRSEEHDQSKLDPPEVEVFDEVSDKLRELEYGSPEYKQALVEMGPALQHHYEHNSHHPEHYEEPGAQVNGLGKMSLLDILEMLCDWKAASLRVSGGDIIKSIDLNMERFGYGREVRDILCKTALELGFI